MSKNISIKVQDNSKAFIAGLRSKSDMILESLGIQAEGHAVDICPVKTGRLKGSITHQQVDSNTEAIGTNVEYASFVELGTSRQRAQPYLKPAIADHISEYKAIIEAGLK